MALVIFAWSKSTYPPSRFLTLVTAILIEYLSITGVLEVEGLLFGVEVEGCLAGELGLLD